MLDAVRESIAFYIAENPCTIKTLVRQKKDNGFGYKIPDLNKTATEVELGIARVSRRYIPDVIMTNAKTPYDFQDQYYLIAEHTATWLKKGIVFAYFNRKFRTDYIEEKTIGGGVAYLICKLEQVDSANVEDFYA